MSLLASRRCQRVRSHWVYLLLAVAFGSGAGMGCGVTSQKPSFPRASLPAVEPDPQPIDGETAFLNNCATCHLGGGGLLGAPRTPDLFEEPLPRGETRGALLQSIRYGIDVPRMPAFEGGLSEEEIRLITDYVLDQRQQVQGVPQKDEQHGR